MGIQFCCFLLLKLWVGHIYLSLVGWTIWQFFRVARGSRKANDILIDALGSPSVTFETLAMEIEPGVYLCEATRIPHHHTRARM